MTLKNFQHAMNYADTNGNIDMDDVVAVKAQGSLNEIVSISVTDWFKKEQLLEIMSKYTFYILFDKCGNMYSRVII